MDKLIWFFTNATAVDVLGPIALPILLGIVLYQSHYPWLIIKYLFKAVRGDGQPRLAPEDRLTGLIVVPSLLRKRDELDAIQRAMAAAASNEYPGALIIVGSIDGYEESPDLYAELTEWVRAHEHRSDVHFVITGKPQRNGKAFAVDHGVHTIRAMVERGELPSPRIFFNLDADCEPSEGALERIVFELTRRSRVTKDRGLLVTAHVAIRRKDYWKGWRHYFTLAGQLRISVAREYLVSMGLGRHDSLLRVLPRVAASGALYCTWIEVVHVASRYAAFLQTLRLRDWLAWWLGAPPPRFSTSNVEPNPYAVPGMGDDTFTSWIALSGTWRGDTLDFDFPRTPAHALWRFVKHYFWRPYRYDPLAKIYTTTPTTFRALFKQRIRWNVSRIWTLQRFLPSMLYHLQIGISAIMDVVLAIIFQSLIMAGLLLTPFTKLPAMWLAMMLLVEGAYLIERIISTFVGLYIDGGLKRDWPKLLALPQAGIYLFVFNIVTTIVGFVRQVLGFGLNTGFTPEHTLIKGGTTRIALAYRFTRFIRLSIRSVVYGDVPFGAFWFGWKETPWTPNGYAGWSKNTTEAVPIAPPKKNAPVAVVVDEPIAEPVAVVVPVPVRASEPVRISRPSLVERELAERRYSRTRSMRSSAP